MRTDLTLTTLILALLAIGPASAAVYKCSSGNGRIEYRAYPCDGDAAQTLLVRGRAVKATPGKPLPPRATPVAQAAAVRAPTEAPPAAPTDRSTD